MKQIAALAVNFDDIAKAINLPAGHRITAVVPQTMTEVASDRLTVLVEGPQLRASHDGSVPQYVTIMRDTRGQTHFDFD